MAASWGMLCSGSELTVVVGFHPVQRHVCSWQCGVGTEREGALPWIIPTGALASDPNPPLVFAAVLPYGAALPGHEVHADPGLCPLDLRLDGR